MRKKIMVFISVVLIFTAAAYTISVKASEKGPGAVHVTEASRENRKKLKITVEEDIPVADIEENEVPLAAFEDSSKQSSSLAVALLQRVLPIILAMVIACFLFILMHRHRTERRILRQITSIDEPITSTDQKKG